MESSLSSKEGNPTTIIANPKLDFLKSFESFCCGNIQLGCQECCRRNTCIERIFDWMTSEVLLSQDSPSFFSV